MSKPFPGLGLDAVAVGEIKRYWFIDVPKPILPRMPEYDIVNRSADRLLLQYAGQMLFLELTLHRPPNLVVSAPVCRLRVVASDKAFIEPIKSGFRIVRQAGPLRRPLERTIVRRQGVPCQGHGVGTDRKQIVRTMMLGDLVNSAPYSGHGGSECSHVEIR